MQFRYKEFFLPAFWLLNVLMNLDAEANKENSEKIIQESDDMLTEAKYINSKTFIARPLDVAILDALAEDPSVPKSITVDIQPSYKNGNFLLRIEYLRKTKKTYWISILEQKN